MKNILIKLTALMVLGVFVNSCELIQQMQQGSSGAKAYPPPQDTTKPKIEDIDIEVTKSVTIPDDGSAPVAGVKPVDSPNRVLTFQKIDEEYEVKNGEVVNVIYDGINPEETYIVYESTFDGYTLRLAYRNDPVNIEFKKLCQIYIVASPELTKMKIPRSLRYEQVIWTPRKDGTWEVRIGTTERGCKSQALRELQELRNQKYENSIPK